MELSAQFVGVWIMFVTYIAIGIEGVAYNATCTGTGAGDCDDANNICVAGTLKCACATNAFRKGGTECATKIGLTKTCTAGQPTNQCADSNAECDTTASTCGCKSAHYVNKDGACDPQIALTKACTTGQPSDQCADANAACNETASKCQCKSTHFVSKTGACKIVATALDGACDTSDSASNQCAVTNSECRKNGTDKCLCKATHYVKGADCAIRIVPGSTCAAHQCVTHASCNTTSKCQCDVGYTAIPAAKPTICSGVTKVTTLLYMFVMPFLLSMMFLLQ